MYFQALRQHRTVSANGVILTEWFYNPISLRALNGAKDVHVKSLSLWATQTFDFLLFPIKCQHVSEFISALHFDVCLDAKPILGMSRWHANCTLLTRLPFRGCCYFTKCLWVHFRENARDRGIWALIGIVFLALFFMLCRKWLSGQIDTVSSDCHKNHIEILFLLSLHFWSKNAVPEDSKPVSARVLECALSSSHHLAPELWQFHKDGFANLALNMPDSWGEGPLPPSPGPTLPQPLSLSPHAGGRQLPQFSKSERPWFPPKLSLNLVACKWEPASFMIGSSNSPVRKVVVWLSFHLGRNSKSERFDLLGSTGAHRSDKGASHSAASQLCLWLSCSPTYLAP